MNLKLKKEHRKIIDTFLSLMMPKCFYSSAEELIVLNSEIAGVATTLMAGSVPRTIPQYWMSNRESNRFNELIEQANPEDRYEIEIYYFMLMATIGVFNYYLKQSND